jgi:hypothetical protein
VVESSANDDSLTSVYGEGGHTSTSRFTCKSLDDAFKD